MAADWAGGRKLLPRRCPQVRKEITVRCLYPHASPDSAPKMAQAMCPSLAPELVPLPAACMCFPFWCLLCRQGYSTYHWLCSTPPSRGGGPTIAIITAAQTWNLPACLRNSLSFTLGVPVPPREGWMLWTFTILERRRAAVTTSSRTLQRTRLTSERGGAAVCTPYLLRVRCLGERKLALRSELTIGTSQKPSLCSLHYVAVRLVNASSFFPLRPSVVPILLFSCPSAETKSTTRFLGASTPDPHHSSSLLCSLPPRCLFSFHSPFCHPFRFTRRCRDPEWRGTRRWSFAHPVTARASSAHAHGRRAQPRAAAPAVPVAAAAALEKAAAAAAVQRPSRRLGKDPRLKRK